MALPGLGRFLGWRHARTALQVPLALVALLMVLDGLQGPQRASGNLATVLAWVHYRGFVILALLVAGNLFCLACPFMLPRNLVRRFRRPAWVWPRRLRHKGVGILLLVLLLFAYELFDLWATPWWTAWIVVAYFITLLVVDGLFRGASFCKYLCPIGQFNFVASLVSPLEVRVRDPQVCADCRTKDCIRGRGERRGCELGLFQARKVGNMDCTFCLDCVHACPYDNVGIRPRLPASELWSDRWRSGIGRFSRRPDLAALATVFTFGALLNAFGMVSPVYAVEAWLGELLGTRSEAPILGLLFVIALVVEPVLLLGMAGGLARRWAGLREGLLPLMTRYAYALVPLGFGIWLAHYSFHFLTAFWTFLPALQGLWARLGGTGAELLSQGIGPGLCTPKGYVGGLPLPGLFYPGPLIPRDWLFPLEVGFIGLGWFGSLLVAYRLAAQDAPRRTWRAFLPWAVLLLLLLLAALWLMGQPMEMRGTPMMG